MKTKVVQHIESESMSVRVTFGTIGLNIQSQPWRGYGRLIGYRQGLESVRDTHISYALYLLGIKVKVKV